MRRPPRWTAGVLLAVVLLGAHLVLWRPARALLTRHVAYPLLAAVPTERYVLDADANALSVIVRPRDAADDTLPRSFRAPAGVKFLLPALLLIALFPYRPYWFYFWLVHLSLGALALAALAAGLAWGAWGFALHGFLETYVVDAVSMAVPLLVLVYARQRREDAAPPPPAQPAGPG